MSNRVTVLEIDTEKFKNNIKKIREFVGNKELMPIVKASGYGTHINKRLDLMNEFNILGLAVVDEAIEIRKMGYEKELFILNQPFIDELEDINKYNITVGISSKEFIRDVNLPINAHLEIETGMNRTGVKIDELDEVIELIKNNSNITITGIYTHLSSADNDDEYTTKQIVKFKEAYDKLKDIFDLKYIHYGASNGLMKYKDNFTNLCRPGLIMYGYETFNGSKEYIDVEGIAKLKSKITFLKEIDEGESVSYSRRFISDKKMMVATIPMGYYDGLRRCMTNTGKVMINGVICPMIGSICMDSFMVDVSGVKNVKVGDEVILFDNENITLESIADIYNTINYEVLCTISDRVIRKFI